MELRKNCVYNQTRECFLGLEVSVADASYAELKDLIGKLALKSGEGLWISPFRGIPDAGVHFPLDLVYLDKDCRVIDLVESFPTFRVGPSSPQPASVLALPAHAIYSSQTQAGDQLVICEADEMQSRLERITNAKGPAVVVQSSTLLQEKPLWTNGPGVLQLEDRSPLEHPKLELPREMRLPESEVSEARPPRSWLQRWWSPDPRRAPRELEPGLAAYYWTGAAPKAHSIRDISSTGLYVVTEERWYPGTLILMTLQRTDGVDDNSERTISVQSRAVRWGTDGVGLQFILSRPSESRRGQVQQTAGADKKALERFLQKLRKDRA